MADSPALKTAKALLERTRPAKEDLAAAAEALIDERRFGYARELLTRARDATDACTPERRELNTRLAYCTYKDPDLPLGQRLDRALELLDLEAGPGKSADPRALGLAGAIYQRKWDADAQVRHLERALVYHRRAHADTEHADWDYAAVNSALVLDQLAWLEEEEARDAGGVSDVADARRQEARGIRAEVVARHPNPPAPGAGAAGTRWWTEVTVGEALFGLGLWGQAEERLTWARKARGDASWEFEAAARHLATLLRIRPAPPGDDDAAKKAEEAEIKRADGVLKAFLRDWAPGAATANRGKVGLALSGGGFRASFFHIGVLAKLAELDALRHVEVLSCVSGGSIVGAHWYLQVRQLLQEHMDADLLDRDRYIELVEQTVDHFVNGVRRNVRMGVFGDVVNNLKTMSPWSTVTRTMRAGDLYEEALYSRVNDGGGAKRWLSGLFVHPMGSEKVRDTDFDPRTDNWCRSAKVPILVLNAATLNTGHNWQFTASWMGEPASGLDEDVDPAERYRRVPYSRAPEKLRRVRLGHAVAASACVPGIFEPLALSGLYEDRTVRLVDGGVHDNEGTASLLSEDCDVMIVSDASGQMASQNTPSAGIVGVPLRSTAILKARVREAEWRELKARRSGGALHELVYVHLRKDLDSPAVAWEGAEPWDPADEACPERQHSEMTSYGVRTDVQELLANIRTDLDSFTEMEAYALMVSGYRMIEQSFEKGVEGFEPPEPPSNGRHPWKFLRVDDSMRTHGESSRALMKVLAAGKSKWGKPFILMPVWAKIAGGALAAALAVTLIIGAIVACSTSILTVGALGIVVAAGIAIFGLGRIAPRVRAGDAVERALMGAFLCTFGLLVALVYRALDPIYLRAGRVPPDS